MFIFAVKLLKALRRTREALKEKGRWASGRSVKNGGGSVNGTVKRSFEAEIRLSGVRREDDSLGTFEEHPGLHHKVHLRGLAEGQIAFTV